MFQVDPLQAVLRTVARGTGMERQGPLEVAAVARPYFSLRHRVAHGRRGARRRDRLDLRGPGGLLRGERRGDRIELGQVRHDGQVQGLDGRDPEPTGLHSLTGILRLEERGRVRHAERPDRVLRGVVVPQIAAEQFALGHGRRRHSALDGFRGGVDGPVYGLFRWCRTAPAVPQLFRGPRGFHLRFGPPLPLLPHRRQRRVYRGGFERAGRRDVLPERVQYGRDDRVRLQVGTEGRGRRHLVRRGR